jgi:hypothetical protein
MIFKITSLETIKDTEIADICCGIIETGHYIDCNGEVRAHICRAIEQNGSTLQKELFRKYRRFDITHEVRKYFTTIDISNHSVKELKIIYSKPSRLLIEHSANEWSVYQSMIGAYKNDRKYQNLFCELERAKNEQRISYLHGGGYGNYPALIRQNNEREYCNVFKYKVCIIVDRDTDTASYYDVNKNGLWLFLCNKNADSLTDDDIYVLNQPEYIWHMWYKRSIENYFPNERYAAIGVNVASIPLDRNDRDYYKFENGTPLGYNKNNLSKLPKGMGRTNYENGLKHFIVNGEDLSELQLLLLKLVKII